MFRWDSSLSTGTSIEFRANCPSRPLCRNRPALGDGACDDGRELAPVFLQLRFQVGDARLARAKLGAIRGEFLHQYVDVIAGIGERAFAHPRRQVPFRFPEFHGTSPSVGVAAQLLEVRPRRIVLIGRRLLREPQRLFPLRDGRIGKLGGKAGEGDRIAGI